MAKHKTLKMTESNFVLVRKTLYLKIPAQMARDSAFPFSEHTKNKKPVKIVMEEDLLRVEK